MEIKYTVSWYKYYVSIHTRHIFLNKSVITSIYIVYED